MVSRKRSALTLGLIITQVASLMMAPVVPMAVANDSATPNTLPGAVPAAAPMSTYSPFNFTGIPPAFQAAQLQSLGNLYGNCFTMGSGNQQTQLADSITQLTMGANKDKLNSAGGELSCSSVKADKCSTAVSNSVPACPKSGDASAVARIFGAARTQAFNANCCVKAKLNELQEANKELSCIAESNALLANQIKSLETTMQQGFQQANKDVAQIDGVITDRNNQLEFVNKKLMGDDVSGKMGLLKLKDEMQKMVAGEMPAQVKNFEDAITNYNKAQEIFVQRQQNQKMALAKQCFTTANSQYVCEVNSPDHCSFGQLIVAKYKELSSSVNGVIQTNKKGQAKSKTSQVEALLAEIFGDMASNTELNPLSEQDFKNQQMDDAKNYRLKNPDDLERVYGARLTALSVDGLDLRLMVVNKFKQCYSDAQGTTNGNMSVKTSDYSKSVNVLEKQNKDIRDAFIPYYKSHADIYSQFWSVMGQTAPIDTSKCQDPNTALAGMLKCAKDLQTNLEAAYTGNALSSSVSVTVPGASTNPVTQFNFSCNGVNGCVTLLQNIVGNLKTETQKLDQTKKKYIQEANVKLDQLKTQMKQILTVQNQALMNRLGQLKNKLSSAGVTDPLQTQPIGKEPLKKGENGLYQMPDNILAVVGGDMEPPLIDPNSASFDNARSMIAQKIVEDRSKEGQSATLLAELDHAQQSCTQQFGEELARRAGTAASNWAASCYKTKCSYSGSNGLAGMSANFEQISREFGIENLSQTSTLRSDITQSLKGIDQKCQELVNSGDEKLGKIKDECGNVLIACSGVSGLDTEVQRACQNPYSSENWLAGYVVPERKPAQADLSKLEGDALKAAQKEAKEQAEADRKAEGKCKDAMSAAKQAKRAFSTWNTTANQIPANCDMQSTNAKKATLDAANWDNALNAGSVH